MNLKPCSMIQCHCFPFHRTVCLSHSKSLSQNNVRTASLLQKRTSTQHRKFICTMYLFSRLNHDFKKGNQIISSVTMLTNRDYVGSHVNRDFLPRNPRIVMAAYEVYRSLLAARLHIRCIVLLRI